MKVFILIGFLSLLAFTHPFARDGGVDTNDDEIWQERIEKARENEEALRNSKDQVQREEEKKEDHHFDTQQSDKKKAQNLVR
jgi:hypothetical protein